MHQRYKHPEEYEKYLKPKWKGRGVEVAEESNSSVDQAPMETNTE